MYSLEQLYHSNSTQLANLSLMSHKNSCSRNVYIPEAHSDWLLLIRVKGTWLPLSSHGVTAFTVVELSVCTDKYSVCSLILPYNYHFKCKPTWMLISLSYSGINPGPRIYFLSLQQMCTPCQFGL